MIPVPEIDDDNHVLLSTLDCSVVQHGVEFNLGIHKYQGNTYSPNGHKYIREFNCDIVPTTIYRVGSVILKKELIFQHFEDRILIRYTLVDGPGETTLRLRPFLAFRNVNELSYENGVASRDYQVVENGIKTSMYKGYPELYMQISKKNEFVFIPDWYRGIEYPKEQERGYVETDPFGGYDPYSSSKGCDEILISSYRRSYFLNSDGTYSKAIASVRAGNVIGGGDWAKDRIVPDCIRAIESGTPIFLRSPFAVRPFEHVLEPLSGYILLAEKMWDDPEKYSEGWNFGPEMSGLSRVIDVANAIVEQYGKGEIVCGKLENDLHEAMLLNLDITKAKTILGWKPSLCCEDTIKLTVDWYRKYKVENVYDICVEQIQEFMLKMQ